MKKTKKQKLKEKCVKVATELKLKKYPFCVFCGRRASTCHHFMHQSRSNYLRTKLYNLIPICSSCHYKLHNGYESLMTGELIKKLGWRWFKRVKKESNIKIKDTVGYWEAELERLKTSYSVEKREAEEGKRKVVEYYLKKEAK